MKFNITKKWVAEVIKEDEEFRDSKEYKIINYPAIPFKFSKTEEEEINEEYEKNHTEFLKEFATACNEYYGDKDFD